MRLGFIPSWIKLRNGKMACLRCGRYHFAVFLVGTRQPRVDVLAAFAQQHQDCWSGQPKVWEKKYA